MGNIEDLLKVLEQLQDHATVGIAEEKSKLKVKKAVEFAFSQSFPTNYHKRRGICSIMLNGFYRPEDFCEEFSDWKGEEAYEIYLDTFKTWYMEDNDEQKLFSKAYETVFTDKGIKNPNTLLLLAGRMTNDIKRGILNIDFEELKSDYKNLIDELYDSGEMEASPLAYSPFAFDTCTYCRDLVDYVNTRAVEYVKKANKEKMARFWLNIKNKQINISNLEQKDYDMQIFLNYNAAEDVLAAIESLSNGELFEFTRWMGSKSETCNKVISNPELDEVVVLLREKYGYSHGVKAGHIKQIIRILCTGNTVYDPKYFENEGILTV